ncbi:MAG: Lrp/AsnC ligand binding domain-containing protein, partial [Bradyrhizobium sp.]
DEPELPLSVAVALHAFVAATPCVLALAQLDDLAGEALGFGLIAFIHITLATHSPDNAKRFRELVNRVDDIQEAYALTGDADYVLKVMLRDLKSLSDIVNNVLMPHQSVAHVRSSIVLDRLKESTKLPLKALQS